MASAELLQPEISNYLILTDQLKGLYQHRADGIVERGLLPAPNALAGQHHRQAVAFGDVLYMAGVSPFIGRLKDRHDKKVGERQKQIDPQGQPQARMKPEHRHEGQGNCRPSLLRGVLPGQGVRGGSATG